MLNVLIADDEKNAQEILSALLLETGMVGSVKTVSEGDQIEIALLNYEPDALFLDIEMPGRSGIQVLEAVREYNNSLPIVIVTAFPKYMDQAIKLNAFSFLTKPVNRKDLEMVLFRLHNLTEEINRDKQKKIAVPVKDGYVYLNIESILTFKAEKNYTEITTIDDEKYLASYNLGKIGSKLPKGRFFRINRSTLLNMAYLKSVNRKNLTCIAKTPTGENEFEISKSFLSKLNSLAMKF